MPRIDFIIVNVLAALFIVCGFVFFDMSMVNKFITMSIILIMLAIYMFLFILKPRKKMGLQGMPSFYHLFMSVYLYLIAYSGVNVVFVNETGHMKMIVTFVLLFAWLVYVFMLFKKCKDRNTKLTW